MGVRLSRLPEFFDRWGVAYELVDGWETRSRSSGDFVDVMAIGVHHTASSTTPANDEAWCIRNSPDKPIGGGLLLRSGVFRLWSVRATNTQGKGGPYLTHRGTIPLDSGNSRIFSIEAANNGTGEPWTPEQIAAYPCICAAVIDCANETTPGAPLDAGDVLAHFEWCVEPGMAILTKRGVIPASDVRGSDMLYTHAGRWQPVLRTRTFTTAGYRVRLRGHPGFECSATHPVLTTVGWVSAGDLTPDHFVIGPSHVEPTGDQIPTVAGFEVTPQLAWVFGAWLADGHVNASKGLRFTVRNEKVPTVLARAAEAGLRMKVGQPKSGAQTLDIYSAPLVAFVRRHFGELSHRKTVPAWLLTDPKLGHEVLLGYLHGDGHWTEDNGSPRWTLTSTSRCLMTGMRLIAHSLGWTTLMNGRTPGGRRMVMGSECEARECWAMSLYPDGCQTGAYVTDDLAAWPVRDVEPLPAVKVKAFEVETDHSFVGDGLFHHNSPGRKFDPAGNSPWAPDAALWDMDAFRGDVWALLAPPPPTPTPEPEDDELNQDQANELHAAYLNSAWTWEQVQALDARMQAIEEVVAQVVAQVWAAPVPNQITGGVNEAWEILSAAHGDAYRAAHDG